MARPLSEEKRHSLLNSALSAVAKSGVAASTLSIAKNARVAEGTLFTYFPTKDDLLNQLYLELKSDLVSHLTAGLMSDTDIKVQFRHLWTRYIDWGMSAPQKHEALRQLEVSHRITAETENATNAMSRELQILVEKGFESEVLRRQPVMFLWGVIQGIAGLVLETAAGDREKARECDDLGWETLWGAIANHKA
jgi:AcrR family transcriptional regulator